MSDKPSNAKQIALHGISGALAGLAATGVGLLVPIGKWMQSNTSTVAVIFGLAGTMLYAWAVLPVSLWRKDSKRSKIREAKELGRPICGCTEAGQIMLATDWGTSFWRDHECPLCKSKQQVKIRD